jgi:fatty-acyl-CoA synthase
MNLVAHAAGTPPGESAMDSVTLSPAILPMGQLIIRGARENPDREAVVFPGLRLSYRQLAERAWQIARSLAGLGLRPGQNVGYLMSNHEDLIAAFFGISIMGAVVVPINARYRTTELDYIARDADLAAIITTDCGDHVDFSELLLNSLAGLRDVDDPKCLDLAAYPQLRTVISLSPTHQSGILSGPRFWDAATDCDDEQLKNWCDALTLRETAMILYTSGTTAAPRGAILTHEAFVRIWMGAGRCFAITPSDRFWDPLPLFHVAALGPMIFTLGHGATFITDYYFDAGRALDQIEAERATLLYPTYPPLTQALLTHPDFPTKDFSRVTAFLNVAPPETLAQFQALAPHAAQLTTYGGTEIGPASLSRVTDGYDERRNTCGKPQPGVQIRIVNADGDSADPGEPGELYVRGFNTFSGYYNHPEKSAESLTPEGWYRSGDYGSMDAHGNVMFLGRIKEVMKVGGENVGPAEIEAQLCMHPAVKLAQVVGIPDPNLVEVPAAFVELHDGASATPEELIDFCKGKIASFKVPRVVRIVTEWPMSATKIQRFRLREELIGQLQTPGS